MNWSKPHHAFLLSFGWLIASTFTILLGVAHAQTLRLGSFPLLILGRQADGTVAPPPWSENDPPDPKSMFFQPADARAILISNFLLRHRSPMRPYDYYGRELVKIADEVGIDFRLLPSIAMQESNLCRVIPEDSYNCLGLGIHSQGTWYFNSYEENFRAAAKILKKNYIDQGLTTPELIMSKYTPSSNGSWAASVNQWMAEMRYDDRVLGAQIPENTDLLEFVEPE